MRESSETDRLLRVASERLGNYGYALPPVWTAIGFCLVGLIVVFLAYSFIAPKRADLTVVLDLSEQCRLERGTPISHEQTVVGTVLRVKWSNGQCTADIDLIDLKLLPAEGYLHPVLSVDDLVVRRIEVLDREPGNHGRYAREDLLGSEVNRLLGPVPFRSLPRALPYVAFGVVVITGFLFLAGIRRGIRLIVLLAIALLLVIGVRYWIISM